MTQFKELNIDNYPQIRFLDKYMENHNGYIAGGCFKNIFNKEKIKDIDIFFENKEDYLQARDYFTKKYIRVFFETDNVVAFRDKTNDIIIELVKKIQKTPEELLSEFDFTIVKFAYYKHKITPTDEDETRVTYEVIAHEDFFEHLFMKRIVIDEELKLPINTFERVLKYTKYGYGMCKYSKVRLLKGLHEQITNLGTNDFEDELLRSLYNGLD